MIKSVVKREQIKESLFQYNIFIYNTHTYLYIHVYLAEKVVKGLVMTASWLKTRPPSLVHLWLCQNTPGHVFNRPRATIGILSKLTPGWPCLIIEAKNILIIFYFFFVSNSFSSGMAREKERDRVKERERREREKRERKKRERERVRKTPSSHIFCIVSFSSRRWYQIVENDK